MKEYVAYLLFCHKNFRFSVISYLIVWSPIQKNTYFCVLHSTSVFYSLKDWKGAIPIWYLQKILEFSITQLCYILFIKNVDVIM